MKPVFKFEVGETKISKAEADKLREVILTKAREKDIGTEPIQYERLLNDIISKMVELNEEYDFSFNGDKVDFSKENFVMFKSKVLKTFLYSKVNDEIITLQKKNLDILSFYAYEKPWTAINNNNIKNGNISNHENEKLIAGKIEELIKLLNNNKVKRIFLAILIFSFIGIILFQYFEKRKLSGFFSERETQYQKQLEIGRDYFFKLKGIDEKYYDTLKLPEDEYRVIFTKDFKVDTSFTFPGKIKMKIIESDNEFLSEPGLKPCNKFGGYLAFGFGTTYCTGNCYELLYKIPYNKQENCTILRIEFSDSTFISFISFKWVEIDGNWGSIGWVFVNNKKIGYDPYQLIGIYPPSNMLKDEKVRPYKCKIGEYLKYIDIAVLDIANESEIFIDEIRLYK
jgi:hypothetical protein